MADPPVREERPAGRWRDEVRDVVVVAVVVVAVVLGLAALSALVPAVGAVFDRLPVAIVVLLGGTAWVLWRIARRPAPG